MAVTSPSGSSWTVTSQPWSSCSATAFHASSWCEAAHAATTAVERSCSALEISSRPPSMNASIVNRKIGMTSANSTMACARSVMRPPLASRALGALLRLDLRDPHQQQVARLRDPQGEVPPPARRVEIDLMERIPRQVDVLPQQATAGVPALDIQLQLGLGHMVRVGVVLWG